MKQTQTKDVAVNAGREPDHRRHYAMLTHVILIFMLFLLPEILMGLGNTREGSDHIRWNAYARALVYVGVFYAEYYFIIDRTLVRSPRRMWRFVGYNILLIALAMFVLWCLAHYAWPQKRWQRLPMMHWKVVSFYIRETGMVVLTIALSVAVKLSAVWLSIERRSRELINEQRDAELNGLKSQLNPHFLFNTLNTIYALIALAPEKAQKAVHELSRLLRYVLYENPETVELGREVAFIKNYIGLMELRHANLPLRVSMPQGASERVKVAPLLFISLIENAFKYGNTGSGSDPIEIELAVEENEVVCRTRNRFDPVRVAAISAASSGIGLSNLRRRIALIYGDRASLSAGPEGQDVFSATLRIPVDANPDSADGAN